MTVVEGDEFASTFRCQDCNVDTIEIKEYYMVSDACWRRSGMQCFGGILCIGCLETRLGKKLKAINFKDCALNWRNLTIPDMASTRLLSRLMNGGKQSKWRRKLLQAYEEALAGDPKMLEELTLLSFDGGA